MSTPPKNSNYAQINKLVGTQDHNRNDNDKTVVHSDCTKDVCNRVMNKDLQTNL